VRQRRPLLANDAAARAILNAWQKANYWIVGRYVLMPDHLHLFCSPATFPPFSVKGWVEYWRSQSTKYWPRPHEKPIWQKDFFDRQLRSGESYRQKWDYIWENPEVAALVKDPADWPYQGELNILSWHEPTT